MHCLVMHCLVMHCLVAHVLVIHYLQDPRFLDRCDERGVLVWEEALAWGNRMNQLINPTFMARTPFLGHSLHPLTPCNASCYNTLHLAANPTSVCGNANVTI